MLPIQWPATETKKYYKNNKNIIKILKGLYSIQANLPQNLHYFLYSYAITQGELFFIFILQEDLFWFQTLDLFKESN